MAEVYVYVFCRFSWLRRLQGKMSEVCYAFHRPNRSHLEEPFVSRSLFKFVINGRMLHKAWTSPLMSGLVGTPNYVRHGCVYIHLHMWVLVFTNANIVQLCFGDWNAALMTERSNISLPNKPYLSQ